VKGPEMRMPAGGGRRACNTCDELSVVWDCIPGADDGKARHHRPFHSVAASPVRGASCSCRSAPAGQAARGRRSKALVGGRSINAAGGEAIDVRAELGLARPPWNTPAGNERGRVDR
jgi:hypothetical protein